MTFSPYLDTSHPPKVLGKFAAFDLEDGDHFALMDLQTGRINLLMEVLHVDHGQGVLKGWVLNGRWTFVVSSRGLGMGWSAYCEEKKESGLYMEIAMHPNRLVRLPHGDRLCRNSYLNECVEFERLAQMHGVLTLVMRRSLGHRFKSAYTRLLLWLRDKVKKELDRVTARREPEQAKKSSKPVSGFEDMDDDIPF